MPTSQVRTWLVDASLAVALLVVVLAEIFVPFSSVVGTGSPGRSALAATLTCLALIPRRRWPLASLVAVLTVCLVGVVAADVFVLFWGQLVPMTMAMYSVARHGPARHSLYGAVVGSVVLLSFDLSVAELRDVGEISFHWIVLAIAWATGGVLRSKETSARKARAHADDVVEESAGRARAAVIEERARIARELHDVVAHAVSMMVVQAGAAAPAVDDNPAFAKAALEAIRTTGVGAMAEMRRMVAMLRVDDVVQDMSPQPGLHALPDLVAATTAAGLEVQVTIWGEARALPTGLDLAAYRIVQEALTNVRRHAKATWADVEIHYGSAQLDLSIVDNGAAGAKMGALGHGIIGMRERASLYGGTFHAGPTDSGFRVGASLPMEQL